MFWTEGLSQSASVFRDGVFGKTLGMYRPIALYEPFAECPPGGTFVYQGISFSHHLISKHCQQAAVTDTFNHSIEKAAVGRSL